MFAHPLPYLLWNWQSLSCVLSNSQVLVLVFSAHLAPSDQKNSRIKCRHCARRGRGGGRVYIETSALYQVSGEEYGSCQSLLINRPVWVVHSDGPKLHGTIIKQCSHDKRQLYPNWPVPYILTLYHSWAPMSPVLLLLYYKLLPISILADCSLLFSDGLDLCVYFVYVQWPKVYTGIGGLFT